MKSILLAALLIGAASPSALPPAPPPTYCRVIVFRDYDLGWAYYAQLRLAPDCPRGGTARVRKTSGISTKARGAPYQPIFPAIGAWTVDEYGDDIPNGSQFTLLGWRWQDYTGKAWRTEEAR